MPPEVYEAAIDLVARNARRAGQNVRVGFHGGGEPTVAWKALTGAIEYARRYRGPHGESPQFELATNGVMSTDKAEFIATTFPGVSLSFDGPPDIQDSQRPRGTNRGSFDDVMAFIEVLRSHETFFAIRSTITDQSVHRLTELVDFFVDHTGCNMLHFEPLYPCGRCHQTPDMAPAPEAFGEAFVAAMRRALEREAKLRYSAGHLRGVSSCFCGCARDGFSVTADGNVTSCYEVCDRRNPLSEKFFFGHLDRSDGAFVFDRERLAQLRSLTVQNKPVCEKCFLKWSCAGDCPVKTEVPIDDFPYETPRCRANRAIAKALLVSALGKSASELF
jgi:uncharacterized protein